jgi:hypothetical protein
MIPWSIWGAGSPKRPDAPNPVCEPMQVSYSVPVSPEMAEYSARMNQMAREMADRMLYPWKYPRLAPFPDIELFPRLTKAQKRAADAVFGLRVRIRRAARVVDGPLKALERRIGPPKHIATGLWDWDD